MKETSILIWRAANLYRVFVCFNNPNNPCEVRGTAHWEGDSFVNDDEGTWEKGIMARYLHLYADFSHFGRGNGS